MKTEEYIRLVWDLREELGNIIGKDPNFVNRSINGNKEVYKVLCYWGDLVRVVFINIPDDLDRFKIIIENLETFDIRTFYYTLGESFSIARALMSVFGR